MIWDFATPLINVDNPEITTLSPFNNVCVGERVVASTDVCTETLVESFQIKFANWYVVTWVSTSTISLPSTSETNAFNPPPLVPLLLNDK